MDRSASVRETSRRTVLLRGGAAIGTALALAGCTEDVGEELPPNEHWPIAELVPDLPVRQRSDVIEARIDDLSSAEIRNVDEFVVALEARDLEFESVSEVADQLHLEYVDPDLQDRGTLAVAGTVAGAYAALINAGFEARALELVFFEADGSTIGLVEVATEWATEFLEGRLSTGEYGELVAGSIESRREPPEPDVAPDE
ncbi:hypothetical protein [Halopiger djelfimassiliensis]|uniref:hypothetical protein n=1 Tax=Halopiger djelfimassiliensis TaxID=1293047 RepID=UPI0006778B95|nr:hypothetical protein [Halopiger djelfimassiliensis]